MRYLKPNAPDHEGNSIACDPHYQEGYGSWKGPYSSFRRCSYQKDTFEHAMDYTREFWRAYNNDRKVFFVNFLDMHEGTHEVISYLDKPLANFIQEFKADNTTILVFADHGPHTGGILQYLGGPQFETERLNPMFIASNLKGLPSDKKHNLERNQ